MRYLILPLALLIGCSNAARTETPGTPRPASAKVAKPAAGLSNLHHPVSTNAEAQRHFDDGMTLVFAFNHDEAIRSFKKAAEADPKLGMAHWGIALALGPNYNVDVDAQREKEAATELQKATELAKDAPQVEKDYIATLSKRFSGAENPDLKKLAHNYADAARELSKKYPDDLDAATLAADALMCLKPWALYDKNYQPVDGTAEIVATLESVLKRDPDHLGANHLYIHAVEASTTPQRALESAARLPGLAPECGHLVHMPSHIYSRVGDHEAGASSNEQAIVVDREYFAKHPEGKGGMYEMMYYPHNIHFAAYAHAYQGNYADASKWAKELYGHAAPHVAHMPMMEGFTTVPMAINVKFHQWQTVLASPSPDQATMPITTAYWHFARGMAFCAAGDLSQAQSERDQLAAIEAKLPADAMFGMLNKAHHVLDIAGHTLDARIAAKSQKYSDAEKHLREAIKLEDELTYMEPPDWLLPSREALGGVLLQAGNFPAAEKVFREELDRSPRGARALLGLSTALEKQGKTYDASMVRRQMDAAWKNADTQLTADQL